MRLVFWRKREVATERELIMTNAILRLPLSSQLSPTNHDTQLLSVDHSQQDLLLNDILKLRAVAGMVQPTPVLTPSDRSAKGAEKMETMLENEYIACFVVSGEKRLCFPQILNAVLRDVRLSEVNSAFTDLNMHCSRCSQEQLEVLKVTGVMPMSADSCGLITKSDAERLVSALLHHRKRPSLHLSSTEHLKKAFSICHDCFGGARGSFVPDLYRSPAAECIECSECREVFAADRFVTHTHVQGYERRTCHWGFDSANWRSYIYLPQTTADKSELKELLNDMKSRFDPTNQTANLTNLLKRSAEQASLCSAIQENQKKIRLLENPVPVNPYLSSPGLFDPSLLTNYYQQVLNSGRFMGVSLVNANGPTTQQRTLSTPTTAVKAAEAAAGLLALSNGPGNERELSNINQSIAPTATAISVKNQQNYLIENAKTLLNSRVMPTEPLKKHLLHQFEEQQRKSAESPVSVTKDRPDSGDTSTASETEDYVTLDALLSKNIPDKEALTQIRSKVADSQRVLETKVDSLTAQNHILQQEIAYLRNKQTGGMSMLGKVAPNLLIGHY